MLCELQYKHGFETKILSENEFIDWECVFPLAISIEVIDWECDTTSMANVGATPISRNKV